MSRHLLDVGKALAAPARVAMVDVLFDGSAHTAGDLARAAGIAPGTASGHLAVLTNAGLVSCRSHGRHRYYTLTDADVASALEQLAQSYTPPPVTSLRLSREQQRVRAARTCYDHLAGQLGVAVADWLIELCWIDPAISSVTAAGADALRDRLDIDVDQPLRTRRPLVRGCKDWTEPGHHVAGVLGAALATTFLTNGWVVRRAGSRGLTIAEDGVRSLTDLGVACPSQADSVRLLAARAAARPA